jgi:HEAT repeat protein
MLNQSDLNVQGEAALWQKNFARRLATALGIQAGEGLPIILLFGQAFFLGVLLIFFYTAANALFLVEFGAQGMPYVYIVAAAVVTLAGLLFSKLEQRLSFPLLLVGTLAFLLISVLALRLGLWFTLRGNPLPLRWLVFTLMVWVRLLWTVTNLVLWALAGRLFNMRQGKRLFPLIMVGAVLAMIMSGFLATPLIALLGAANLMFIAAGGLAVGLLFLLLTIRQFHDQLSHSQQEDKGESSLAQSQLRGLFKNRYIVLIVMYTAFSTLATYVLDFIFVSQAEVRYADVDALASFFGNYVGLSTIFILLTSAFSGKILNRYGMKVGLLCNSFLVATGAVAMATIGTLFASLDPLFWLVVLSKLFDDMLGVVSVSSIRILYQPLPTSQQVPVQTLVESVVNPLSIGLVGVMLLLFGLLENFTTIGAVYLLLVALACWIGSAFFLNREYGVVLKQALTKRHLAGSPLRSGRSPIRIDRSSIELLQQGLTSRHVGAVIYSLDMLEENKPELLPTLLPDLLTHPAPEVRRDVLRRIERLRLTSTLPAIKESIKDQEALHAEQSPLVQGSLSLSKGASLRVLAALSDSQQLQEVYPYLESPLPEVKQGVMIGLLRSGEIEAILAAGEKLIQMIHSGDPAERAFAAQVLGEGGIPFVAPLLKLLQDDEVEVQRAALVAAGKLKHSQLWPVVITLLAEAKVRASAVTALVAGGQAVLNQIKSAFTSQATRLSQEGEGQELLIRLAQICGRIRGAEAIALLEQQLDFPDEQVGFHILVALNQCGYQAPEEKMAFIEQAIKADIAHITWLLAVLSDFGAQEPLLSTALTSQMASYRRRLFLWLSFLYDPQLIQQLQDTLGVADSQKQAYAIEIIQTFISTDLSKLLIPLLNDESSALQRLKVHYPQQRRDRKQRLHEIISLANKRLDSWTRACALYTVAEADATDELTDELRQAVIEALSAPEPLVRETAAWTVAKLEPVDGERYMGHLRDDPDAAVAKTVRYLTEGAKQGDIAMLLMVEKIIALKSSTFFAKTKEYALAEVAAMLKEVELKAGEILFEKGQLGDCMYIMYSGEVRLHDGERTFEQLGEGGAFGELALLSPAPRSGQATAISDACLLRLDADPFYELIADHSEVARAIMEVLAQRLRRW